MKPKTIQTLSLLNSEGDILIAYKIKKNLYVILDQENALLGGFNEKELFDFTRGRLEIMDSLGRSHNYMSYPGSMKPDLRELDIFINCYDPNASY